LRKYSKILISMALTFCVVNVLLAFLGQDDIGIYFIVDAIAYFIIVLYINITDRKLVIGLHTTSALMFIGFLFVIALEIIEIL
jgi:hypothetical protein